MALAKMVRSFPEMTDSAQPFWDRLAATAAWCRHLSAAAKDKSMRTRYRTGYTTPRALERDYFATVESVSRAVDQEIRANRLTPAVPFRYRLLVYFPDEELSDRAAGVETEGYFDIHNCPPWDTWVAMAEDDDGRRYLVCYVPDDLVDMVDAGIDANSEGCIDWLENVQVGIHHLIHQGRLRLVR